MASKTVSPRQKMINMMYLVLLAMLALNVSNEVLEAFSSIRTQLEDAVTEADAQSLGFMDQMKAEIDREIENEGNRQNLGLKDTLDVIRDKTQEMVRLLDRHVLEMENIAEYDTELQDYRRKDELEANYQYWMGQDEDANKRRGNGEAMALRDQLNDYYAYLADLYNGQVVDDSFKINAYQLRDPAPKKADPDKRWEQYTFEGPVLANMATLEALKIDLFRQEKQLLDLLNTRLGVHVFVPDTIIPISAPASRIVPAGMQFQTQLFVGLSSKQIKPQFESNSGRIELQNDGNTALLTIPARGNLIPRGQNEARQTYTANIQVPKATGGYHELKVQEEFTVRKPEAVITSAAVQQLYRNCANPLNIDVPALGSEYQPVIEASQATVSQSNRSVKRFQVVPTGQRCNISISSRTQGQLVAIDQIPYQVIEPPKPSFDLIIGNRTYNGSAAIPAGSSLSLKIRPDREFQRQLPEEARYRVQAIEILLKDGLGAARVVSTLQVAGRNAMNGIQFRLPTEVRQARPGSRVFIRITDIARRNYRGQYFVDERFSERDLTLPLVIRN
ncbi:MAG: hypothetical protein AAF399_08790 [Bacteroidota bacterium]